MKDIIKGMAIGVSMVSVGVYAVLSIFMVMDKNTDMMRACVAPGIVFLVFFSFVRVIQETNLDDTDSQ